MPAGEDPLGHAHVGRVLLHGELDASATSTTGPSQAGMEGVDIVVPGKPQKRYQALGGLDQANASSGAPGNVIDRPALRATGEPGDGGPPPVTVYPVPSPAGTSGFGAGVFLAPPTN